MITEYLQALVIILGISAIIVFILGKLKISSVVGFLVAGILIGPFGLNLIKDVHSIEILAEIGVVLLMFTIGLEFSLKNLFQLKTIVLGGGGLQVGLTIACTAIVSCVFYRQTISAGIFHGFIVALSSTAIVFKILFDRAEMNSPPGRFSVGILIFQDLCVVPFMLLVPVLAGSTGGGGSIALTLAKAFLVIGLMLFASRWLVPHILRHIVGSRSRELFVISIITLCLGTAVLTSALGLSLALGAFLAGMIISESEYSAQAVSDIIPFKESFTGLFFISVGMLLDVGILAGNFSAILKMVLIIVLVKAGVLAITSLILGNSVKTSITAGLYLFQIGEFSFVLALAGKHQGLISENLYQAFLAASIITMILTPFLIRASAGIARWAVTKTPLSALERRKHRADRERYPKSIRDHVIIVGFGLNGGNLARILRSTGIEYVVLELNSKTVRSAKRKHEPIFYGDGTSADILHKLGIGTANILVIAISDAASTRRIVQLARSDNSRLYIIARTRYVAEVDELKQLGANDVIPEEFETSIEIFSKVLHHLNVPINDIREHIEKTRSDNYRALRVVKLPRKYLVEHEDVLKDIVVETYRIRSRSVSDDTTLRDLDLRSKTGVTAIGLERSGKIQRMPSAALRLMADDVLLFIGKRADIDCAIEFLDSDKDNPVQCPVRKDEIE
jgi:monovalent cation:H+ antiporter-2, CPA2 family